MACSNSSCQSGCYNHEDDGETPTPSPSPSPSPTNAAANGSTCIKCKANAAGEDGRFCAECFRSSLFGKFRFAVTSNGMINPTDKVVVAFSGGTASRVALQFVHEMQEKAQKNFDASRDRSLPVFGVGVAFIDESLVRSVPSCEHDKVVEHIKSVVSSLAPPSKELHVIHIESIYGSDVAYGKSRLRDLLDSVSDVTGKEDLLLYQRMLCLQKIAIENGYNKLILGSCTSRLACHVLSATVKGQGYSLPADIQYVDSRWEIPVMLPLRDCLLQELNMLCQLDGLRTLEMASNLGSSINTLVSSFVTLLQEENPSRECTILRTAGKLTPFSFNKLPDIDDPDASSAFRRRQKKFNLKSNESTTPELFCSLCNGPLHSSDLTSSHSCGSGNLIAADFVATCCSTCRFQILPHDPSSMDHFYSLLPEPMISRAKVPRSSDQKWLRDKIQEFLLSDSEDGT